MIPCLRVEKLTLRSQLVRNQRAKNQRVRNQPVKNQKRTLMIHMLNQFWRNAAAVIASAQMNSHKVTHSASASQLSAVQCSLVFLHWLSPPFFSCGTSSASWTNTSIGGTLWSASSWLCHYWSEQALLFHGSPRTTRLLEHFSLPPRSLLWFQLSCLLFGISSTS